MKTRYVTFFLIAVMTLGLVFLLVTRQRAAHDAPAEVLEIVEAGADAGGLAVAMADASAADASLALVDAAKVAERPLRVAALGWELVAPGVGVAPSPTLTFELAPETALDAVEARLARGGSDPQGADIAILPLPSFVASYERLRALDPRVFLVLGFSHGREEVHAAPGALTKAPPGADEVRLVAFGPTATPSGAAGVGAGTNESATMLGLFALDQLGVAPARIRIVAPDATDAKTALLAAVVKGTADERKLAFSTADASHLVPVVAIAPSGVLAGREAQLREWTKIWLDGAAKTRSDVPGIARRLAAKEMLPLASGVGGAPEALALVERLGQIENTPLEDEARYFGTSAPVTLASLAQKTWQLERAAGLTANAAPEPLPIDARIVTAVAPPARPVATEEPDAGTVAKFGPAAAGAVPLLTYRAVEGDADRVATQILFLSGVFDRATFRVAAKGGVKAATAIANAARAKGVPASRLATSAAEPGVLAAVDVLSQ